MSDWRGLRRGIGSGAGRGAGISREENPGPPGSGEGSSARGTADDAGAGTVMALGICALSIALLLAGLLVVQASSSASVAATAADLAALAGADTARGLRDGDPCGVAREVAQRNRAQLRECSVDPGRETVTVEASVTAALLPWPASARARAGPPEEPPGPQGELSGVPEPAG